MRDSDRYAGAPLLDFLLTHLHLRRDIHLAHRLGVAPSMLCKIRKCSKVPSAGLLIRIHEETGLAIATLRALMQKPAPIAHTTTPHDVARAAHLL